MGYRYARQRADHTDLAQGCVLRSAPGYPGFPVRFASELLQRAAARVEHDGPVGMWDPCCGSGYLATVLGLLHRERLARVLASDVDADAVAVAERNLDLLAEGGLRRRERELRADAERFGKPALTERAEAARRLAGRFSRAGGALPAVVRRQDAFAPDPPDVPVDVVLTDVPYGGLSQWRGLAPAETEPAVSLMAALASVLPGGAVVGVTARTRKVPLPAGVSPLERVRVGNRAAVLVRAADVAGG
ncbi:RRNA methyltransferase AviRa [Haloactinospora alba]|uniref:rRNA methyltransferase AviRa n=1 Tax=Haloactinospora alba TaxID=405555 RepID=A0A543NN87_9ACTN|nr:rRNA methyltransferase [Haloactinospora alba]TQN33294.1 RRNA methyltransferase AviRa [Haloactinospora alba]